MNVRIRTIKPEWLDDERLALASSDARVLSIALILLADDHGNGRASETLLAGRVFPGRDSRRLAASLRELVESRFVIIYETEGQRYYHIRNWDRHQRVDNAGKPKVPRFQDGGFVEVTAEPEDSRGDSPRDSASRRGSPLDQDQDQDRDQDQDQFPAAAADPRLLTGRPTPAPVRTAAAAPAKPDPFAAARGVIRGAYARAFEARYGSQPSDTSADTTDAEAALVHRATATGREIRELGEAAVRAWFDSKAAGWRQRPRFLWLLRDLGDVLADAKHADEPEESPSISQLFEAIGGAR